VRGSRRLDVAMFGSHKLLLGAPELVDEVTGDCASS
jgi:hypothetical protein